MPYRLAATAILLALLTGCGGGLAPIGERPSAALAEPAGESVHTVRAGDTLYSIAFRHNLSYQEVARWNDINPPYAIYPGQTIRLRPPEGEVRRARLESSRQEGVEAGRDETDPQRDGQSRTAPAESPAGEEPGSDAGEPVTAASSVDSVAVDWTWPADGDILQSYQSSGTGRRGIRIGGREGQEVRAAAGGDVVYSGSGLIGYGNLIIIKHDNDYLSAYGHNRSLRVGEGERVRKGTHIADMGRSGSDRPMLHFEIRKQGRPVDPAKYLPER